MADKSSSNTEAKIASMKCKKSDQHRNSPKQDVELLLFINNRMPIICDEDSSENYDNMANKLQCISPQTRLVLLAGTTIFSVVFAMCFLLSIRLSCPKSCQIPTNQKLLSCNESLTNPLENFFGNDVSFLIWCNPKLGKSLAIITAILLSIAIYLRHPVNPKLKYRGLSRNSVLKTNLLLLIIGLFACMNCILLACHDILTKPHHIIFALSFFISFILYELGHNCCLLNDMFRNRMFIWKNQSKDSFRQRYVILTSLALMFGVTMSLFTIGGCILRVKLGYDGSRFQWMAILSIGGYILPVYLLIAIRDYLLYQQH